MINSEPSRVRGRSAPGQKYAQVQGPISLLCTSFAPSLYGNITKWGAA